MYLDELQGSKGVISEDDEDTPSVSETQNMSSLKKIDNIFSMESNTMIPGMLLSDESKQQSSIKTPPPQPDKQMFTCKSFTIKHF